MGLTFALSITKKDMITLRKSKKRGQRGLVIRNEEEKLTVEIVTKAHSWLNEKFGLQTELVLSRECSWGKDAKHAGLYINSDNEVWLNFRNLYGSSIYTILQVLGHEIRHGIQYSTGVLSDGSSRGNKGRYISGTWKGKYMFVRYEEAPWEIDARKYEKEYADMAIEALGLEKYKDIKLPMGTQTEVLRNETAREFLKDKPNVKLFVAYLDNGKSNPKGFCWLDLSQTNYQKWDKQTLSSSWKDYYDLMQSQFVEYKVKTSPYGNFDLDKLVS